MEIPTIILIGWLKANVNGKQRKEKYDSIMTTTTTYLNEPVFAFNRRAKR